MYQFKKILVTGAAGFIGCNFVRYLLNNFPNIHVYSLDKLTYAGNLKNLSSLPNEKNHTFIRGDICDKTLVNSLLRENEIETIVHFAAESHVDRSISNPAEFIQTNVMGTFVLLEAAKKYWFEEKKWNSENCRFHHISTDEVYGTLSLTDDAFSEKTPYAPNSPYSASKAGSDHLVRAFFHTYALPVTTSNCSNNYGPYQHDEKLIPTVIRHCLNHSPIPVYGNGSNIRDWLFVEDHCSAIVKILTHGCCGEVYNVGGKNELDNLSLIHNICSILDELKPSDKKYSSYISFVTDRLGHDFRYAINNAKIQNELNWEPKYSLKQGLLETIQFYLDAQSSVN
jgi:dTDP-glucose 4,6-dehydratase